MDCHILLYNIGSSAESFYRATDESSGRGVSCLTGHRNFSIYAFAESCTLPKIFVVAYPANSVLFNLEGDGKSASYVSLCFSESEYLVVLTGEPDYSLEVYVWRSKEILIKRPTGVLTNLQRVLFSPAATLTVCQLAYTKSIIKLWEIHGNVRFCRLIERNIRLPFAKEYAPLDCCFAIDGTLMIANSHGAVYCYNSSTGQLIQIIKPSVKHPTEIQTCLFYCKGGLLLNEPTGILSYFKRQKGSWNQLWDVSPPEPFLNLINYSSNDGLYATTVTGSIIRMTVENEPRNVIFSTVKHFNCGFTEFVLLNPLGEIVLATSISKEIVVFEVESGSKLNSFTIEAMSCIRANPLYPFIAVGTLSGTVTLVSVYNAREHKILADFHLSNNSIVNVEFSEDAANMAVCDDSRNMFILKGLPGSNIEVVFHLEMSEVLQQPLFYANDGIFQILGLVEENDLQMCDTLQAVTINPISKNFQTGVVSLPKKYCQIERKWNHINRFYAIVSLSNDIDILDLNFGENEEEITIKIFSTFKVKHQIPYFQIGLSDQFHMISWSVDGLASLYDAKTDKLLAYFISHDRAQNGIQAVRTDPLHQYVISLGYAGILVCSKMHRSTKNLAYLHEMRLDLETDDVAAMFCKRLDDIGSPSSRWVDLEKILCLENEKLGYEPRKLELLEEFKSVKLELRFLLDANEETQEEEQLPIQAFNLNAIMMEQLKNKAKEDCEVEYQKLLNYIIHQNEVNGKIVQKCWEIMERKPIKVRSIFTKLALENYPCLPREIDEDFLQKINIYRQTELMASHDALLPWKPTPTYQLESILNRDPDYGNVIDVLSRAAEKKYYSLTGTTSHLFVEPTALRLEQLEVVTFEQLYFEKIHGNTEMIKLRDYFNKKFDNLKQLKDNEMDTVIKRNQRLRVIHQELATICKLLELDEYEPDHVTDPRYNPDEIPETIVKTDDQEISVPPYLTPSMENLKALEKAERERRQRELMADDFKDRALIVMMDGVLEHRWEDEIKKTPPVPACLETGKDPTHYNETDLREVQEYEDQIEFLHNERMRYRQLLMEEKADILDALENQIQRFNTKVGEGLLEKIRIESAIREEEMRILRNAFYNHKRLMYERNIRRLRSEIDVYHKHIEESTETMNELQEKVIDCKNTYENLCTKDKMLDKQFKVNFSDTAQSAIIDQAYKIFKKRPKAQLRAVVTVSIFQDLAKRITSKKGSHHTDVLLPQECVEYLTACDVLDQQSNCPAGMDANLWQTLCRMRRIKLESEFRMKSCEIQLADSEAGLNAFQREIVIKKNFLSLQEVKQAELQKNKFEDSTNRTVQIVLKRGLIEVPMSGETLDFDNCILIHRSDVDDINVIIKRAGAKKLKAMVNAALFRRKIIAKEWDHQAMRLKIRDMNDQIKMVEKCKITKEVQDWLKRKEAGKVEDLGQLALEREIENTIFMQEKMLAEVKKSLQEIEDRIIAKRKENKLLDKQTQDLNVDVTEQHLRKNTELEEAVEKASQTRMLAIIERARLVRLVQAQHAQILELGTMLELQRLKTYPTLTAPTAAADSSTKIVKV
ncbi:cilia- and flagella-associated protein 43 isoform X2 [Uranotaenia lowii]|nr:cilia- and flagella-associated protein 43 isoform X2 [Uranotaenia lowii]XP_055586102.1 cilia- and flagella-associated protein 43 isoform X2 [Uranotaenia lowii]